MSGIRDPRRCPECNRILENEYQCYVFAVKQKGETKIFIAGNDSGWFCRRCPLVVLDDEEIRGVVAVAIDSPENVQYVVLGIVDLEAVPEDKKAMPFDEKSNPIPLVEFIRKK